MRTDMQTLVRDLCDLLPAGQLVLSHSYNLGEIVIPCLLLVCSDYVMHGNYASYFVNTSFTSRVNSLTDKRHGMTISPTLLGYDELVVTIVTSPVKHSVFL